MIYKKQEDVIPNQKDKQSLKTDGKILELVSIAAITMFKNLKEKLDIVHEQMGNFS